MNYTGIKNINDLLKRAAKELEEPIDIMADDSFVNNFNINWSTLHYVHPEWDKPDPSVGISWWTPYDYVLEAEATTSMSKEDAAELLLHYDSFQNYLNSIGKKILFNEDKLNDFKQTFVDMFHASADEDLVNDIESIFDNQLEIEITKINDKNNIVYITLILSVA